MKKLFKIFFAFLFTLLLIQVWAENGNGKGKTPTAGELAFKKYNCSTCHGEKGVGVGDLRQAWIKYNDEQMRAYISNPAIYNNVKMPAFGSIISEQDWPVLLEYVRKLGKEGASNAN